MNAFEVLGLSMNADQAQVRAAYRDHVKRCHPDQFQEKEQQERAQEQLIRLNKAIAEDPALGKGFRIGHSYLCLKKDETYSEEWLQSIVEYDILPTLQEYWFDDQDKLTVWENNLRGVFNA